MNDKHLLEADLCYKVIGTFYSVANKYGKGLKEQIYQKALAEEFDKEGLNFEQQKRINVYSLETAKTLGAYVPDFLVENKVIVEIKSSEFTTKRDIDQQRAYLRASIYEIAYLVNFGTGKLDIRRSIYTNDRKPFVVLLNKNL
jgi:GxxExxY protein